MFGAAIGSEIAVSIGAPDTFAYGVMLPQCSLTVNEGLWMLRRRWQAVCRALFSTNMMPSDTSAKWAKVNKLL